LKIFLHGAVAARSPRTASIVRPGEHPESDPSEWYKDGVPVQFEVIFHYGAAEVTNSLGKYMVQQGMAKTTRLILPKEFRTA
jgi:hypothetical protein